MNDRLMSTRRFIVVLVAVAAAGCASNRGSHLSSSQQAQIAQIDAALDLVGQRRFKDAEAIIQPLIHAKHFARLPSAEQYRALSTAAKLAFTLKEPTLEYESRVRLLALPEATFQDRISRLNAAARVGNTAETIAVLTDMVQKNPQSLAHLNDQAIFNQLNEAEKKLPHGAALPLMQALFAAHWKVKWDQEPSGVWQDLALLLLEQHRLPEAIEVATHVTEEFALISMRADKRFDPITTANPGQFDIDAALKHRIEHIQSVAESNPKALFPRIIVIELLMEQQHYGAALAAADDLVAEIRQRSDAKQWYSDFGLQYAWVLDTRSRALQRVGRWDESVDQLAAASWVLETDGENVSQVINLGALYCDVGMPKAALLALERLGTHMSNYGRMQEADVRLDAAIQLGDTEETAKWLGFEKEHRSEAPRTYADALLRMNDSETAAQWLIERLADPDQRLSTLLAIQEYATPKETARQSELRQRRRDLIARPDVQAAIQKVGRIDSYKLERHLQ
jgi:tetratricopeptide (TPR) repeat protein